MIHAMDGGLWLHRHRWLGEPMAHLISADREVLENYGRQNGLPLSRLQFKRLKDPRTGVRVDTWHWDLVGCFVPARIAASGLSVREPRQREGGKAPRERR
jgi:hypothetical protein